MYQVLKQIKLAFSINILLSLLTAVASAYAGYILSFFVNIFQDKMPSISDILKLFAFQLLVWTVTIFLIFITEKHQNYLLKTFKISFREYIIKNLLDREIEDILEEDKAVYLSWLTNDAKEVVVSSFIALLKAIQAIFTVVAAFIAIVALGWTISIAAVLLFFFVLLVPQVLSKRLSKATERLTKSEQEFTSKTQNLLYGLPLLLSNNKRSVFSKMIHRISIEHEDVVRHRNDARTETSALSAYASLVSQIALTGVAAISVILGHSLVGALLAIGNLSGAFFQNICSFIENFMTFKSSQVIWEKYIRDEEAVQMNDRKELKEELLSIHTSDVSFSYDDTKAI